MKKNKYLKWLKNLGILTEELETKDESIRVSDNSYTLLEGNIMIITFYNN